MILNNIHPNENFLFFFPKDTLTHSDPVEKPNVQFIWFPGPGATTAEFR